jgi:hypothetical protein
MFKTRAYEESHPSKHDDSHFACDYMEQADEDDSGEDEDKETRRRRAYASLIRIVVHEMYPGGPKRTIVEDDWFTEFNVLKLSKNQ